MKEFAKSKACAAKTLYAVMKGMKDNGGSMPSKDILSYVEKTVQFTDWEKERAGKMQNIRWHSNLQFYSIDYSVAGFIVKKKGVWYITPEGESALPLGAEEIMIRANTAYHAFDKERKSNAASAEVDDENDDVKERIIDLEELEDKARSGIQDFIRAKGPYEFQDMVAALLRAMGYHTPFIAPKGKDGGIDIVAYFDPLGAKEPRVKVQVKHYPDSPISAKDIRALVGVLKSGDIGLFVTSGTFSPDARRESINSKEYIRIIDGSEFIDMWNEYYEKMSDEDKNRLPLKRIAFLGSNE